MLVMGNGKEAMTGAMLAVILLTGLYAFLRKSAITDYSKKLRQAFLTQVQAADIDTSNATPEQLAEISKSYTLPKKPLLAKTENDKFVLPLITIVAVLVTLIPSPAEVPKAAAVSATNSTPTTAGQDTNSGSESASRPGGYVMTSNIKDALKPYRLDETTEHVTQILQAMYDGSPSQAVENSIRKQQRPPKGDRGASRALNNEGLNLLHNGNISAAVDKFAEAVKADPTDVEAVDNLGFALLKVDRVGEAERVLLAALSLDPTRAGAWFNFGDAMARDQVNTKIAYLGLMVGYHYCNADRREKTKQLWNRMISDPGTDPQVSATMKEALSSIQQRESAGKSR